MQKKSLYLSLLLVILLANCHHNLEDIMSNVINSVVKIEATLYNGVNTGSGFIIDKNGFIVTNNHVLGESSQPIFDLKVKLHDYRTFEGDNVGIVYRNQHQDIAILKVNESGMTALSIGDPVTYLQDVYVIGYPMGQLKTEIGKITSKEEIVLDEFSYIPMNATLDPGFSGAPVVNKMGKVIGIASRMQGNNLNYSVPIRYVRSVLDKVGNVGDCISIDRGNLIFEDDDVYWNIVKGDWTRYSGHLVHISKVSVPYEEGVYGLIVTNTSCNDFILETKMMSIARIDGYKNIDIEVVFRYLDEDNFYCYDSYSGEADPPIFKHDKGGLWKVQNGVWKLLQGSSLIQEFQNDRWYSVKIIAKGPYIQVCVDNIKCIDVDDYSFQSGRVGYRTTSSHAWFGFLKVFSLF